MPAESIRDHYKIKADQTEDYPIGVEHYKELSEILRINGCRFIGRLYHIAARHQIHTGNVPTQESLRSLFKKFNTDFHMVEYSEMFGSSHPSRAGTGDNHGRIGDTQLKALKEAFMPIAHVLAAMDVIMCRAHDADTRPKLITPEKIPYKLPNFDRPHHVDLPFDEQSISTLHHMPGRSFLDSWTEERFLDATLSYALWFQKWMGINKVAGYGKLVIIETDDYSKATLIPMNLFKWSNGGSASTKDIFDTQNNINAYRALKIKDLDYEFRMKAYQMIQTQDVLSDTEYKLPLSWIAEAYGPAGSPVEDLIREGVTQTDHNDRQCAPGRSRWMLMPPLPSKIEKHLVEFVSASAVGKPHRQQSGRGRS